MVSIPHATSRKSVFDAMSAVSVGLIPHLRHFLQTGVKRAELLSEVSFFYLNSKYAASRKSCFKGRAFVWTHLRPSRIYPRVKRPARSICNVA